MTLPGTGALRSFNESRMYETCDIERFVSERDEYGDETRTWSVVGTVLCLRKPLSGQESVLAERLAPEVNTRIVLPYGTDVTVEDQLVVAGRRYSIDYIPDVSPNLSSAVGAFCRYVEEAS